jgi:predicted molibdopterin-dependent oxidoreductase YjgC
MPHLRFTFGGRRLQARPGQTVAAALIENDILSWRRTRHSAAPRGLFCGIGVCYDCLLTVDGRPGQRACLVPLREGMTLTGDADAARSGDV